jgi:hypothetical protein
MVDIELFVELLVADRERLKERIAELEKKNSKLDDICMELYTENTALLRAAPYYD